MTEARGARHDPIATIALVILIGLHVVVAAHLIGRSLDHDEGEHLRVGAWMASGKSLYRDFVENHTPFLYLILERFAPAQNDFDAVQRYIFSARAIAAIAGTAAALLVAVVATRATGSAITGIAALAALLTRGWTYDRSTIDIRPEPFTLLLFWCGTLLIVSRDARPRTAALIRGAGAGLIAVCALWNPKWPLETIAVLIWYAATLRAARVADALLSIVVAAVIPALAWIAVMRTAPFGALVFFGYRYPAAFYAWFAKSPLIPATFRFPAPFEYCSPWFAPFLAIPAIVLFAITCAVQWRTVDRYRIKLMLLLGGFVIAGALEIRFLYSYPHLWPQYFVMWGCSLAAMYGIVIGAWIRQRAWIAVAILGLVAVYANHEIAEIRTDVDRTHWQFKQAVLDTLRPKEGVWLQPEDCPFPAPAGSYYWYAYKDQVPFSLAYAHSPVAGRWLPHLTEADLPPCRMLDAHLHGLPDGAVYVRYVDERNVRNLPRSADCLAALVQRHRAERLGASPVFEIARPPRRQ